MAVKAQFQFQSKTIAKFLKKFREPHQIYLLFISVIGLSLLGLSVASLEMSSVSGLALFALLAILSAFTTTSVPELTFEIGSAVSMAAIPLYGPFGAIIVGTVGTVATWIAVKNTGHSRSSLRQLLFNIGMQNITMGFVGGLYVYLYPYSQLSQSYLLPFIWLALAIIQDQTNFWLVMVMLRLQVGSSFSLLDAWQDTRWAMLLNVLMIWLGGGLVAYASFRFGFTGVLAYFIPLGLSAYAFRLYVHKMQGHMDNLELIISERTDELKQLVLEKDSFLAMLTHDMKTPLTTIGLYAQMLASRPEAILKKPHMATSILRGQKTLLDLVNNILDIEQLQSGGGFKIRKEHFDFTALLETTLESLQTLAAEKEIELNLELKVNKTVMFGDESQLKRVITNLISNGIKYSPKESQVVAVLDANEQKISLTVKDNGYGIPEADLPFIFDRYRRVDAHRDKAVGTGLGLSVVQAIVESHEGSIKVDSEEGVGTTFVVSLPLQHSDANGATHIG